MSDLHSVRAELHERHARLRRAADNLEQAHDQLMRDLFGDDLETIRRLEKVAQQIRAPRLRIVKDEHGTA